MFLDELFRLDWVDAEPLPQHFQSTEVRTALSSVASSVLIEKQPSEATFYHVSEGGGHFFDTLPLQSASFLVVGLADESDCGQHFGDIIESSDLQSAQSTFVLYL